ncbi:hypothetical protein [Paraburkholderia franconis]|uniref:hypothetical protein n=1 Tax=Paraburkholderia franconis TaxID=2654983 RepID=UPI00223925D7|nr:hypothetical protein [Paraburkholderia franconis]
MFRIDDATAATSLPVPEAAGTEGYWTEGNPATGVPATLERASWFNMVQEEIRNVVVAAGLTPSKTTYTQLRDAIKNLYGPGRLLRTSVYAIVSGQQQVSVNGSAFATTGATTFVPLSNTSTVIGEAQGGGAAGGGAGGAGASTVSMGAPGGSGSYGKSIWPVATIGASQTITVGAGGAGVSNGTGGNGGSSSIGSLLTAPGGVGGGPQNNQTPPAANGNGSFSTAPTGANLISIRGTSVQASLGLSTSAAIAGTGGGTPFGLGATGPGINTTGIAAVNYGTAGSGVVVNQSGGNAAGGAGFSGVVVMTEYA